MLFRSSKHRIFSQIFCSMKRLNVSVSSSQRPVVCLHLQNNVFLRRKMATLPEKREREELETLPIFAQFGKEIKNIYQFPFISYCNWIVNLKWYLFPAIGALSILLEEDASQGEVDLEIINAYVLGFAVILVKSCLLSFPFINFVAHIYITPKEDVILSYLNFLGARVDEKFPKGDLYLQSRQRGRFENVRLDSMYMLLISKSTRRKFRINFKHCDMFDEDLFISAIGKIPQSAVE